MKTKPIRCELMVDAEFYAVVDAWRRTQGDLPGRSEAIRRMVMSMEPAAPVKEAPKAATIDTRQADIEPYIASLPAVAKTKPKAPRKTKPRPKTFDKNAYQRELMKQRRAAAKVAAAETIAAEAA